MPEASQKKRSNQPSGSAKLSKRGISVENAPVTEDVATPEAADIDDANDIVVAQELPIPEPVIDIMRTEPVLYPLYIENYTGECDDQGFYHGNGAVQLKDGMSYSGTFKHGKMHEKGELQWFKDTIFSGDFIENVISGSGTYTWPDGSSYQGEVLRGLRHGYGTFICSDSKIYTGDWENGKRHGKGILYYDGSGLSYYNGDWLGNEKCGYGYRRFAKGNTYEGEWKDNKRNGNGTMYWYTNGQEYTGNWVDGVQNGHGEYSWYLKRVTNSQYPLRNKYIGDFLNGERHGHGVFHYASGATYDGEWQHNMKHGTGKFTFKNGSVFNGQFHNDHMIDFPDLILPRMMTPDIVESGIPVASSSTSLRSKSAMDITQNAVDTFLDLDLDDIFVDYCYDLEERQEEVENIMRTVLRHITKLKNIYKIYSCLGSDATVDNTYVMSKCQFLRFLKDYNVHRFGYTLAEIERHLEENITMDACFKELYIKDFLNYLVKISYHLFKEEVADDARIISNSFSKLITCIIQGTDVNVNGYVFKSINRTQEVYKYIDKIFHIYFYFGDSLYPTKNKLLSLHDVLLILKDMNLISESLDCKSLVDILTQEERDEEGYYNLNNEITPFEFLEVIVASSSLFVCDQLIEKHRPSQVIPILSLNQVQNGKPITFIDKDLESKVDDIEHVQSISLEEVPIKDNDTDSTILSPVKSNKSSGKMSRKAIAGKKAEKEISSTTISKGKKEASRLTSRKSSVKMDDVKLKSIGSQDVSSVEPVVNEESLVMMDSSIESTLPHSDLDDPNPIISETELVAESSIEMDVVKPNTEKDDDVIEIEENFELWSLRFILFLTEYLFPQFKKRKALDSIIKV